MSASTSSLTAQQIVDQISQRLIVLEVNLCGWRSDGWDEPRYNDRLAVCVCLRPEFDGLLNPMGDDFREDTATLNLIVRGSHGALLWDEAAYVDELGERGVFHYLLDDRPLALEAMQAAIIPLSPTSLQERAALRQELERGTSQRPDLQL